MMKKKSLLLIILGAFVFACGLLIWALNSPRVDDYRWIHRRDTETDLVFAFSTALRINHPAAYDMIDPSLKPRLDEWMNVHQSQRCTRQAYIFGYVPGTKEGRKTDLGCFGQNNGLSFEVDNIVIEDMKVIDWGEVTEELY